MKWMEAPEEWKLPEVALGIAVINYVQIIDKANNVTGRKEINLEEKRKKKC